jgi:cytochrome c553
VQADDSSETKTLVTSIKSSPSKMELNPKMRIIHPAFCLALTLGTSVAAFSSQASAQQQDKPSAAQLEFFEKKIRPLLADNCYVCHSEHHKEAGGLRVDDYKAITNLGKSGQAVVPGDSAKSILIQRVTHPDDSKTMPPDNRLTEAQIADLKAWIDDGAAWPALVIPDGTDQTLEAGVVPHQELKESHWAWQPLKKVTVPEIAADSANAQWPRTDVDKFVLASLQSKNLGPVDDANKSVLLRRLTYDLTGLPPTQEEVLAFLLDESPKAVETVVDRLLASTAFGERWGRHWLDVARYGESTGSARNLPYPHAWRYRDYVIDSFNRDKPFDKFLQEQIAGDQLPASSLGEKREQLTATGFLALGVKDVNQRFKVRYEMDNVDEQIDTVSRSVLGLTVSCARCHDHKFDPVATRDYYALAGIFASTELCDALKNQMGGAGLAYYVPDRLITLSEKTSELSEADLQQQQEVKKAEFEAARLAFTTLRDSVKQKDRGEEHTKKLQQARQAMQRKQAELVALTDPAKSGPVAIGVRDAKKITDTEIRIRGEAEKLGPVVPRGFLSLLDHVPARSIEEGRSGRYELAKWLTDKSNPLTSRVVVNRIWQHLFSEGIVRTVDNFGSTGELPSHPELLDYLAGKFAEEGWSFKKLIRQLVLSRTYQLSSASHEVALASDPANRYLWRHSPRRLEAEEIRDSILTIAGKLDRKRPDGSAAKDLPVIEIRNNGQEAKDLLTAAGQSTLRSVYLPLVRGIVPNALEVFDFAEQGLVTGKRTNTTVAPQALFLLNDVFVRKNSLAFAESLAQENGSINDQITKAYRIVLHRQPSTEEIKKATDFVQDYKSQYASLKPSTVNEASKVASTDSASSETPSPAVAAPVSVTGTPAPATAAPAVVAADSRDVEFKVEDLGKDLEPKTNEDAAIAALVQALLSSAEFRYVR